MKKKPKWRKFSLPFDYIHDPLSGYGRLLFPVPWKKDRYGDIKWIMITKKQTHSRRFELTDTFGFHNCTKTGVY